MKMLSLELDNILDDNMDKVDKANVSTIVGDFKIMDKADVADVSAIVGVKMSHASWSSRLTSVDMKGVC